MQTVYQVKYLITNILKKKGRTNFSVKKIQSWIKEVESFGFDYKIFDTKILTLFFADEVTKTSFISS